MAKPKTKAVEINYNKPTVGMTYKVYGTLGVITKVYSAGTMDVELPSGRTVRVTGLPWI